MAEDESPGSRRTLRRTLLAVARAAALIIIVTGINGLLVPLFPHYRPVWGYVVAVLLGGIASGFVTGIAAGALALIGQLLIFGAPGVVGGLALAIAAVAGGLIGRARRLSRGEAILPVQEKEETETEVSLPHDISLLAAEVRRVETAREEDRTRAASEMSDALETIRQLHDELNEARTALAELQREHADLQEQHREQKSAGGELLGRADTLVAELNTELEAARAAAEEAARLRADDAEQARLRDAHLQNDARQTLEELHRTRASSDELRVALEEAQERLANVTSSYEQVTVELANERDLARAAAGRVHELQQAHGRSDAGRAQLERVNDELRRKFDAELQRLQRESGEKMAQLDRQWNDKLQKIVAELASDHENDLGEAVGAREAARAEVRSLNVRLQEIQHQMEAARTARTELLRTNEGLTRQLEEARGKVGVDEKALRARIDVEWSAKLQKIINELVTDQENAIGEALELREAARAETRGLNIRVQELEKRLRDSESSRAELRRRTEEMPLPPPEIDRRQIDAEWSAKLQKIVNELAADHETDIGTAIEAREAARAEVRDLNTRITNLQQKMESDRQRMKSERESLFAHLQELEQEIIQMRKRPAQTQTQPLPRMLEEELPFGPLVALPEAEEPAAPLLESDEERRARADVLQFAEQANAALRRASAPENLTPPVEGPKPLILIVHHDPALRGLYRDKLQSNGFRVITAADGVEGLRLAAAQKPEVVIADAVMPKMDGHELCRLLKSNAETASSKVVLMTGIYTNEGPRPAAERAFEPDELMRKPVKFDALKNALTTLLAAKTA